MATNIDKDTLADSISQLITLKVTPNGYDSLYLSNIDQREIEPTPETKIDDDSAKTLTPSTPIEYSFVNSQSKQEHPCSKMSNKLLNPQCNRKHKLLDNLKRY